MPDKPDAPYCKIISAEWVKARYGVAAESILEEMKRADLMCRQRVVSVANDEEDHSRAA